MPWPEENEIIFWTGRQFLKWITLQLEWYYIPYLCITDGLEQQTIPMWITQR